MFHTDILLVDLETTSDNPNVCEPIQIGAALLDKETLEVKEEYVKLIKPQTNDWQEAAANVHGLNRDFLIKAGYDRKLVFAELESIFDFTSLRLSSWNVLDIEVIRKFAKSGIGNTHKALELWSFTYPYFVMNNIELPKERTHGLDFACEHFGIKRINAHDALEDVRVEAEVLRCVAKHYSSYNVKH